MPSTSLFCCFAASVIAGEMHNFPVAAILRIPLFLVLDLSEAASTLTAFLDTKYIQIEWMRMEWTVALHRVCA